MEKLDNYSELYLQWSGTTRKGDHYQILLMTPFQKSPPVKHYRLDIWEKGKVLGIAWDSKENYAISTFRRGDWEKTVLSWNEAGAVGEPDLSL